MSCSPVYADLWRQSNLGRPDRMGDVDVSLEEHGLDGLGVADAHQTEGRRTRRSWDHDVVAKWTGHRVQQRRCQRIRPTGQLQCLAASLRLRFPLQLSNRSIYL